MLVARTIAPTARCGRVDGIHHALTEWERLLGSDRVRRSADASAQFAPNTMGTHRRIAGSVHPRSEDEVRQVVEIAARWRVPLYPISTGHNWGYGTSSPVVDDCVIVDLSAMNEIRDFDADLGLVTVGPGVTQGDLAAFLEQHQLPFAVPVHGGGPKCSILGNALERGFGITPIASHWDAVTSLTAVLADGSIYRSALAEQGGQRVDAAYKWGVGPYLEGLFSQGNFGIVTSVTVSLFRLPEVVEMFVAELPSDWHRVVPGLRTALGELGNIVGGINIMNRHRVQTLRDGEVPPWLMVGSLYGSRELARGARAALRRCLGDCGARVRFFSRTRVRRLQRLSRWLPRRWGHTMLAELAALSRGLEYVHGRPDTAALSLVYASQPVGPDADPARDQRGLRWFAPLVPMKAEDTQRFCQIVDRVAEQFKIALPVTFSMASPLCCCATIPVTFERADPASAGRALAVHRVLAARCADAGYIAYRSSVDAMPKGSGRTGSFARLVAQLRKAWDPHDIIAPGRYCPPSRNRSLSAVENPS